MKTCLVRFDSNKYSVAARAVGRPVEVHAYADRIVIRQDGEIVAEHARRFGRDQTVYDPWHYVPVLARKPGALRNGAPFKDWALPGALGRVRVRLAGHDDGDMCQRRRKNVPARRRKNVLRAGWELVPVVHGRDPRAGRRALRAAGGGPRVGGACGPTGPSGGLFGRLPAS